MAGFRHGPALLKSPRKRYDAVAISNKVEVGVGGSRAR